MPFWARDIYYRLESNDALRMERVLRNLANHTPSVDCRELFDGVADKIRTDAIEMVIEESVKSG